MQSDVVQRILRGSLQVVSYPTSGLPGEIEGEPSLALDEIEGLSARGFATLYSVKCLLAKETNVAQPQTFLEDLVAEHTLKEIMSICDLWPPNCRSTVDDVLSLPLFAHSESLRHTETIYGEPGVIEFRDLLSGQLGSSNTSSAVVIARAPEIVACVKFAVSGKTFFVLFDVFPKDSHPDGPGLFISPSILPIAHLLTMLLKVGTWTTPYQAHHYYAHVFVSNPQGTEFPALRNAILESSRAILKFQAGISLLKAQALPGGHKPENADLGKLRREAEDLRAEVASLDSRNKSLASRVTHLEEVEAELGRVRRELTTLREENAGMDSRNRALVRERDRLEVEVAERNTLTRETVTLRNRIRDLETENASITTARAAEERRSKREVVALRCALLEMAHSYSNRVPNFDCSICLESHPETEGARIEPCNHMLCKESLRSFISTELRARRFPIHCPTCAGQPTRSVITEAIVRQVGITEEDLAIWYELELRPFAVLVECRGPLCKRSFFLDKDDFAGVEFITCPIPRCRHRWCKNCSATVKNLTAHSCDGTLEFDALRKEQRWQKCPGCQSTIERTTGCDLMTCSMCNTRFYYSSGGRR